MPVDQFEQLFVHGFGLFLLATSQSFGGAMVQMILHQIASDAAERFLDGGDLRDDVGAVAVFFDHFLQAADLAFDAAETLAIGFLEGGIYPGGFAPLGTRFTSAIRDGAVPFAGSRARSGLVCPNHPNTPQTYIYPYPLSKSSPGEKLPRFNAKLARLSAFRIVAILCVPS